MLGDNRRLGKHLREHGKAAGGELLDFKQRPWSNTRGGGKGIVGATKMVYRLKLRVTPEDEPAFDAEITDEWSQFSEPRIGMTVPVLYDPKHHSKVVLDRADSSRVGLHERWASEGEPTAERAARGSTAPSPAAKPSRLELQSASRMEAQGRPCPLGPDVSWKEYYELWNTDQVECKRRVAEMARANPDLVRQAFNVPRDRPLKIERPEGGFEMVDPQRPPSPLPPTQSSA